VANKHSAEYHDWREARRDRALELLHAGWLAREVAEAVGVSEAAVSQWASMERKEGSAAWLRHVRPGRPPKLTPEQLAMIPSFLLHGAEAYGFYGDVWTRARVGAVIERELNVTYSQRQVGRILQRLDWTLHTPKMVALQRDEQAISHWRSIVWPELQVKAKTEGRTIVFVDESAFYLMPGLVRTYAPRGQRVVLPHIKTNDHLSVMSGITTAGQLYTLVRDESLNSVHTIAFLFHLFRHLGSLLVVWDGSPIHRGEVRTFLGAGGSPHIHVEQLPPYAPELNPDEAVWGYLKNVELKNVSCVGLTDLRAHLDAAVHRLRAKRKILRSFFAEAGLRLQRT